MEFKSYHKIHQFRDIIRHVNQHTKYIETKEDGTVIYDENKELPILKFTGSVKLHGTNAGVIVQGNEIYVQSRNNWITPEKDNAGFAKFVYENKQAFIDIADDQHVIIYGEWAGPRIQKGVAINNLPEKAFFIFDIRTLDGKWLPVTIKNKDRIYNIYNFPTYSIDIDFTNPKIAQNLIVEITNSIEKECPVAKQLGIEGVGEGVVFKHESEQWGRLIFKSKGLKHSVTRVKKLANIDIEKVNSLKDFAEYSATENRMEQIYQELGSTNLTVKDTGTFLKALAQDIYSEEKHTMESNNIVSKETNKYISQIGKDWFFKKLQEV